GRPQKAPITTQVMPLHSSSTMLPTTSGSQSMPRPRRELSSRPLPSRNSMTLAHSRVRSWRPRHQLWNISRAQNSTTPTLLTSRLGISSCGMGDGNGSDRRSGTLARRSAAEAPPQAVELAGVGTDQLRMVDHQQVLDIAGAGAAGPVEAAVEQQPAVEQGELVVHVEGAVVDTQGHALGQQVLDVAALIKLLVVVADHPHRHAAAVTGDYLLAEAVVGDGVDADVHRLAGLAAKLADLAQTLLAGTEVRTGHRRAWRRAGGIESLDHLLQPLQRRLGVGRLQHQFAHQGEGAIAQVTHLVRAEVAAQLAQLVAFVVAQFQVGQAVAQLPVQVGEVHSVSP